MTQICATPFCGKPATAAVALATIEYPLCGSCADRMFSDLSKTHEWVTRRKLTTEERA